MVDNAPKPEWVHVSSYPEARFTLQFYIEDCTGCALCIEACPAVSPREVDVKAINMADKLPLLEAERRNVAFFLLSQRNFRNPDSLGRANYMKILQGYDTLQPARRI